MKDPRGIISHIFFQVRSPKRDSCEPGVGEAASNQPRDKLPSKSTQKSSQDGQDTGWPIFFDGEKLLPSEFKEDLWRCPFCDHWTNRIRQHLKTHSEKIPDWTAADNFCNEVSALKRRRLEKKRTADPKRKESQAKREQKQT